MPFPHYYSVRSTIKPDTRSQLMSDGLTPIDSEPPIELAVRVSTGLPRRF